MYYMIEADSCNKWPWIYFLQQTLRCNGVSLKKWTHVTQTTRYNYQHTKLFKLVLFSTTRRRSWSFGATGSKEGNVYLSRKWQFSSQRRDESYCSCGRCVKPPLCLCISVSDLAEEKTLDSSVYIC